MVLVHEFARDFARTREDRPRITELEHDFKQFHFSFFNGADSALQNRRLTQVELKNIFLG
jgi:hypothetical protein